MSPTESSTLTEELDAARAQVRQLEAKVTGMSEELRAALRERDEANARVRLAQAGVEDVWLWQGDGGDDPPSLSCPVVMSADRLRALLAETQAWRGTAIRLLALNLLVAARWLAVVGAQTLLVVRKRDMGPPEVREFNADYGEAARFFESASGFLDSSSAQWTHTYLCAVLAGPGQPLPEASLALKAIRAKEEARAAGCPGRVGCHGSMAWCQEHGSVGLLCDMEGQCDLHRERWIEHLLERRPSFIGEVFDRGVAKGWREAREHFQQRMEDAERRANSSQGEASVLDHLVFHGTGADGRVDVYALFREAVPAPRTMPEAIWLGWAVGRVVELRRAARALMPAFRSAALGTAPQAPWPQWKELVDAVEAFGSVDFSPPAVPPSLLLALITQARRRYEGKPEVAVLDELAAEVKHLQPGTGPA